MASLLLGHELVEFDVEVSEGNDVIAANGPIGFSVAHQLRLLRAPDTLIRDSALAAVGTVPDATSRRLWSDIIDFVGSFDDDGEIVAVDRVFRPIKVLGAAAPSAAGSSVTVSLGMEVAGEAGLELTIGGLGVKGGAKYSLRQDLEIECDAGEARVASLLVPFDLETRMWRPPGAGESFPVERLVPVIGRKVRFGARSDKATLEQLLASASGVSAPIGGGDEPVRGTQTESLELSWSVEIGVDFGEANKIGVSAGLAGSVTVSTEYNVPAGEFLLRWLGGPAGACLTD